MKVSVLITTYNHEKYVKQALESVVNQKVNFKYEVIIGDDCSLDSTVKILEDFQHSASCQVKLLLNKKNVGVTKNIQQCLNLCSGEYIAFLEGDDYWFSPLKLKKQVDFLDKHIDCSFCFNGIFLLRDNGVFYPHYIDIFTSRQFFTTEDLISENIIGNFSACMYRKSIVERLPKSIYDIYTVDWMFNLVNSLQGKIGCIPEQMSVYRQHSNGSWTNKSPIEQINFLLDLIPKYQLIIGNQFDSLFNARENDSRKTLFFEYKKQKKYRECQKMAFMIFKSYLKNATKCVKISIKKILKFLLPTRLVQYLKREFYA